MLKKIVSLILTLAFIFVAMPFAFASDVIAVTINGTPVVFDTPPQIVNSRTLVPVRAIFEALGGQVVWNAETKTATSVLNGVTIILTIDHNIALKNNEQITLDVPPQIIGDRTLVPVRFIGEASGAKVDWDSNTRTVVITNGSSISDGSIEAIYFNTTKFFGQTQYSADATVTNGALCTAGIRLLVNEVELNYWGLKSEEPFVHNDARSLFLAGRDVLGTDKVTLEFINKNAIVSDAISVLAYYGENNLTTPIKIDRSILLKDVDKNKEITHKELATLLMEIDAQGGLLNKFIVTDKVVKAQSAIEIDLSKYPSNKANFQTILKEIPTKVYETAYSATGKMPKTGYDFAREYNLVFTRMLTDLVKVAKDKGVALSLTYYPSISLNNGNGYTMRVKCDVINVNGNVNIKDVYTTNEDLTLTNGLSFFCDFNNNEVIGDMTMPIDKMTLDKIIK
jgi:hypothetical protein